VGTSELRVEHLDPATLLVDVNVRHDARLDADFLASIREHGVLVPIVAVRTSDGHVRVRYGHRRTLAAVEAQRDAVPVVVVGDDSDTDADQVTRLLTQYAENTHRSGLTTSEQVDVFTQLAAFGLTPGQIARRTRARKADVTAALAVADSDLAKAASERYEFLTLDQAATVAAFDDDAEAVKALVAAAKGGQFDHVAQRLRDERERSQASARLTDVMTEARIPVIEQPDYTDKKITAIRDLSHDGQPLTEEMHATCPGRAAYIRPAWTDALVQAVHVCTDPRAHGHSDRHSGITKAAGPLTEHEKAERAQVRENNAAWRSAEKVRRDWLRTFLARKTAPKDAATYIAAEIASGSHHLRRALERSHPLGRDILGHNTSGQGWRSGEDITRTVEQANPARAQMIALGLILTAHEDATGVHSWRNPDRATRRYLRYLVANGYSPADVERLVIDSGADSETPSDPAGDDTDTDDAHAA
jgi:ParB family transcriptional regulator, chromosome partitioning protein